MYLTVAREQHAASNRIYRVVMKEGRSALHKKHKRNLSTEPCTTRSQTSVVLPMQCSPRQQPPKVI